VGNKKSGMAGVSEESTETLLTVVQVAQRLSVSTATVYKLCNEGLLAHVRVLNAVRISSTALATLGAKGRRRA
jgi:excisionase family DNA binding protein